MISRTLVARALAAASALTVFAAPAAAQQIDRIVTFGDSYADQGNAFEAGFSNSAYPTQRFSNTYNYLDILSKLLGVPDDNFAVGGAEALNDNTLCYGGYPQFCGRGFQYQVDAFLSGGGAQGAQQPIYPTVSGTFDEHDLVTISIGGNDARLYQLFNPASTTAAAATAAGASIAAATAGLNDLVAAGAPTISFLAGDTSILPEIAGNPTAQAIRHAYSDAYATGMQGVLAGYAANGVIVHYLDLNTIGQEIAANPALFGLTSAGPCPAAQATQCVTDASFANQYLFYVDALHLTAGGYSVIARYVAAQVEGPLVLQGASDMALDTANQWGRTLTTRMDLSAPHDGDAPEGTHFYVVGDEFQRSTHATDDHDPFRTSSIGLTLGADMGLGAGTVGAAINYSRPKVNFGNDAADNGGHSVQLGVYGAAGLGGGFAQGYLGYGWDKHDIDRRGVIDTLHASPSGHHWVAGAKAGYLLPFGIVRVGPVVALDYANARVKGYTEDGDPALALNVDAVKVHSLRGDVGLELRGDSAPGGLHLRPYGAAFLEKDLAGDDRAIRFAQTSAPGIVNTWDVDNSKKAYARFTGGAAADLFGNVALNVSLSTTAGKPEGNESSAHLGVRVGF